MKKNMLSVLCGVLIFGFAGPSYSTLIFELNLEYSGGTSPAGAAPWLVATFQDTGANIVSLTLDARGLAGSEKVGEWCFNIAPGFEEAILITPDSGIFNYGPQNYYSAGPADGFDMAFNFPTSEANHLGQAIKSPTCFKGKASMRPTLPLQTKAVAGLFFCSPCSVHRAEFR